MERRAESSRKEPCGADSLTVVDLLGTKPQGPEVIAAGHEVTGQSSHGARCCCGPARAGSAAEPWVRVPSSTG